MPPPLLIDLAGVDLNGVVLTREQIYEYLPHRHEFMLLDRVCHADQQKRELIACCDLDAGAWWVRGHVPGRPILPGVLMLEMAAQAAALGAKLTGEYDDFVGYGGVDHCKFREAVYPGTRLYLLTVGTDFRKRRIVSQIQGVADDRIVFEAEITGLTMPT